MAPSPQQSVQRWHWLGVVAPPLGFLLFYGVHTPSQPLFSADSLGYRDFSAIRDGGYPFFLAVLKSTVRDLGDVVVAQRIVYAFAILVLGYELLRGSGHAWLTALASSVLLFNPEVNRYHFSILTESLFLSVTALFVAASLAHFRLGTMRSLAAASALTGVLIAIRPTGWAFVPALAILAFHRRPPRVIGLWKPLWAIILPLAVVLVLEGSYYAAHHPGPRQSLLPQHLLAKAGMIEARGTAPPSDTHDVRALREAIENDLAPIRRLIAEAPNFSVRCVLGASYEGFVQYGFAEQQRADLIAKEGFAVISRIALDRLGANPLGAVRLGLQHLYCLWTLGAADADELAALKAYVQARRPLPFASKMGLDFNAVRFPPFPWLLRFGMLLAAALLAGSALALLVAFVRGRRPSVSLAIGGLCGMITHSALLLTAAGGIGIPRYVLGLWVPLALGFVFSALWLAGAGARPMAHASGDAGG